MLQYNFTDSVRRTLARSREEAIALRHDYVGTEHILLALLRVEEAQPMLKVLGVDPAVVRESINDSVRRGKSTINLGELPYTSRGKKVLEYAMSEARDQNHSYVGEEHLFVGLLREEKGIAAQILNHHGVTIALARRIAFAMEEAAPASRFHVRVDDSAEVSIYEQIVAQIQEAVATGALQPGERLPTVRQLADQLDIAPGTVARAYVELDRRGVVVTDGTRGTRVANRRRPGVSDEDRPETLVGLLRPVAVAAYHLGATPKELFLALRQAIKGIFKDEEDGGPRPPESIDA